jgi:hypothetical protein
MPGKKSQEQFINECESRYPNKINFTKTIYINGTTEAIFICKECKTEYLRKPQKMLSNKTHGCPNCIGGIADTTESFIIKANIKRNSNNEFIYDLVIYVNSHTNVLIKCVKEGHVYPQTPNHHLSGDGCPVCAGRIQNLEQFIELSNIKFKDVGKFTFPNALYKNVDTKLKGICPKGHPFTTTPREHLRKNSKGNCKKCARIEASIRKKDNIDDFIRKANEVHKNFYTYLKSIYIDSQTPLIITCSIHGDFPQLPSSHLYGCGCNLCGIEKSRRAKLLSEEEIIKIINDLKLEYLYISFHKIEGRIYINLQCKKHGLFTNRLDHLRNGHTCWKCSSNCSKEQIEWLTYMQISCGYIQHAKNIGEFNIPSTKFWVDGYSESNNIVYEYHGDMWHGNPKKFKLDDINPKNKKSFGELYENTKKRIEIIRSLNYPVVELWEADWKRAKKSVKILQEIWRNR